MRRAQKVTGTLINSRLTDVFGGRFGVRESGDHAPPRHGLIG
jgi:hypothetical protein